MSFQTPEFMLFLLIIFLFYQLMPGKRLFLLALADLAFYALAGWGASALFILITVANYYLGLQLNGKHKRAFLWTGIGINVLNLLFFKYTLFLVSTLEKVLSVPLLPKVPFLTEIMLPVGISFYTFQFIAYLVDVYKGKIPPSRNVFEFWVFMSFFPHVLSGPIMRGGDLIPQVERLTGIDVRNNIRMGMAYLAMGLFKKIVIADYIAIYANDFFARSASLGTVETWIAAYLYTFQLYFDFSAYSEMAVGIAYLFGIKLNLNFKTPYLSGNANEFWKRWHITLSSWIRDYLYIPLGGSRKGELRKYLNLFLAMSISGLWHGAAWTFVIWGMYHGLLIIIHNLYLKIKTRLGIKRFFESKVYKAGAVFVFFHLVCIGWVFFRAAGIQQATQMVSKMLSFGQIDLTIYTGKYLFLIVILFALHILENWLRSHAMILGETWHRIFPAPVRALVYTAFILLLILLTQGQSNDFIYFKF